MNENEVANEEVNTPNISVRVQHGNLRIQLTIDLMIVAVAY